MQPGGHRFDPDTLHVPRHAAVWLASALVVALATACGGSDTAAPAGPGSSAVASVSVSPAAISIARDGTAHLTATALDAAGRTLTGRSTTWATSDPAVARVLATGDVTGVAAGTATISATSEGKSGTAAVTVVASVDFAIADARFTQGVQDALGSIPMIRGGLPAAVNVLLTSTRQVAEPFQLVLRLFDAHGAIVRTDTVMVAGTLSATADFAAPSAQFLVPASVLDSATSWQLVRDPRHVAPDDSAGDDVFPRAGTAALSTVAVPPLTVRFVPIVLASNGNATAQISDAELPEYLQTLRSIYPLGRIDAHVGAPFTTSLSFGTPPSSGGDIAFWSQLVADLDLARIADPNEPTANWYGVVAPPPDFNYTIYGGFSYTPTSGAATGPHTRTSAGVRVGWFSRPTQARDLVAHELGHTFGRLHAPCGGAGSPLDANYPVPGGLLDAPGHDVYAWSTGAATSAATIPVTTGDVMGYCFPVWASTYTYRAILAFRQEAVVAARAEAAPVARSRVLVIRGTVNAGRSISLEPVLALNARVAIPDKAGAYTAIGRARDGAVLFSYQFDPAPLDHAPHVRHFTIALPAAGIEDALDAVEVRGPEGRVVMRASAPAAAALAQATATRVGPGRGATRVTCGDRGSRAVVVLNGANGSVLGIGAGGALALQARPGSPISVSCSDGIHTVRSALVAPN
ncbi:MAG TPA: Ig-like domain-containing protein [Gemmatimonadaceae bacterium]|nr:Ig-like domain-containing protein [Gemmatimonadaceae bacterium]